MLTQFADVPLCNARKQVRLPGGSGSSARRCRVVARVWPLASTSMIAEAPSTSIVHRLKFVQDSRRGLYCVPIVVLHAEHDEIQDDIMADEQVFRLFVEDCHELERVASGAFQNRRTVSPGGKPQQQRRNNQGRDDQSAQDPDGSAGVHVLGTHHPFTDRRQTSALEQQYAVG